MSDQKFSFGAVAMWILSWLLALFATWVAVGFWATGSDAYINEILLGGAPWLAAVAILLRRYMLAAIAYSLMAVALLTAGWGPVSMMISAIPLAMAGVSFALARQAAPGR